jgi:sugar-specific transcriptional regulator TrmB
MATWREKVDELVRELQQDRDELRVKAALGKAELKEELAELDTKLDELKAKAAVWADKADDRMDDVLDEAKERTSSWMKELKEGYSRLRDRLDKDDASPPA